MTEPGTAVQFTFDNRPVDAVPGQTIGGALHEAGVHVLSRSFKYHRPRGLFCATGRCPNCLCTVDGEPNVRTCVTPVRDGARVESQNAWPSLRWDLLSLLDRLHRLMPVGFYYRTMHRPRWLWPLFESLIRRVAGLGRVDRERGGVIRYDQQSRHTDVAVIGGGWAGLQAALAAAGQGADVVLVDDQRQLGGHLQYDPELAGPVDWEGLVAEVIAHPQISVLSNACVFGCYEDRLLAIQSGHRMTRLRAGRVVVATGGWDEPLVFLNNDRPGILLSGGVQRLLTTDGCRFPGEAVIVTDNSQGYRVARQLAEAGTRVVAVVDHNETPSGDPGGLTVHNGQTVVAARGGRHVTAAVLGSLSESAVETRVIRCRWIIQAVGLTPATSLLAQAGSRLAFDESRGMFLVKNLADGYATAGAVNGTRDLDACGAEGQQAGSAAGSDSEPIPVASGETGRGPELSAPQGKKSFVCLCEDVTDRDLRDAVAEGFANIETLKRYSTVCMGPCQGKMCQSASIRTCARANGRSIAETGRTTARPPEQPVPLGLLAGRAPFLHQVRRTPLHGWHEAAGATFLDAGAWKRPESYGDPAEEYRAVRERVGLIDVSTLGKLELRGRDVAEFLEFVYPNRFRKLAVGRVRYGVVCDESGIIVDDGTIARLDEERYFLTTTTGNAAGVDSWFRWWLADRVDEEVRLTNVTGGLAAMNLAGPRSREVLEKICDEDLTTEALPYLSASQFMVAGVPAIVLRIGFVGELGYEIHVPGQFGLHVWNALMEAGDDQGIVPFGVEAQRRLRLDKQHILAGHDTDALSNPLEAGLPWIVRLDKPDFVGRRALERAARREPGQRLVGFRIAAELVPEEASLVLQDGMLGGRVTSARYSPVAGSTVGLAWVPASKAANGQEITIQIDGRPEIAVVQETPFYDPAGERLKG